MNIQLDLFLDSRAVMLANEAVRAILDRDGPRALHYTCELRAEASDYPTLRPLETLGRALVEWRRTASDVTSILSAIGWLEQVVVPAAREAFGASGDDVLAPFFRDLVETSRGLAYVPSHGKAHCAWLSLRCGDWEQAEDFALGIPGASAIPDALHWLTVARYRRRGLSAARPTLFGLAWRDPSRLAVLIDELQDEVLERDFRRFNGACEWTDIEARELPAWFPAWYVLEHPAAAADFDVDEASMAAPVQAARLVARVLERERQGDWKALVALRDRFRLLSVDLFSLYMARREARHSR
jgi:hypothetical protein